MGTLQQGASTTLLKHFRVKILECHSVFVPAARNPGDPYAIAEPRKHLPVNEATTGDIVEQYIKQRCNGPYVECVEDPPIDCVGPANVFVSHAWKYNMIDLLDQLIIMGENMPGRYFWIDVLVVDQNDTGDLPHSFWSVTFKNAIQDIGHTVLVLAPWNNPVPLARAWCLWEVYCTLDSGVKIDILLPKSEHLLLRASVQKDFDVLTEAMMEVDAEQADAHNMLDRDMIFSAIRRLDGGFHRFNLTIKKLLRKWVYRKF